MCSNSKFVTEELYLIVVFLITATSGIHTHFLEYIFERQAKNRRVTKNIYPFYAFIYEIADEQIKYGEMQELHAEESFYNGP